MSYVRKRQMMNNQELIKNLIPLWYATRLWAEELLRRRLDLADAADVLKPENRGKKTIQGTNWMYRTHGVGVDIYKTEDVGGIDFDFDKPTPDPWRMKIFFRRQYNDGNLNLELYGELFEDEDMLDKELAELLELRT
jgi:hypothetical protein